MDCLYINEKLVKNVPFVTKRTLLFLKGHFSNRKVDTIDFRDHQRTTQNWIGTSSKATIESLGVFRLAPLKSIK